MNILKKIGTLCLLIFVTISFCACKNSDTPPSEKDINSMFEYYSVSTSNDYTISYESNDFIEEDETSITLVKDSKIKISPNVTTFDENYLASGTESQIANGFNINGTFYPFDYFDNNYYYITKDTTISISYKTISLLGILIYQNLPGNNDYLNNNTNLKTLVSITNSNFSTENIFTLYYNFTNNSNTNTLFYLSDSQYKDILTLEIFSETTHISTCLVFNDNESTLYYCNFSSKIIDSNDTKLLYNLDDLVINTTKYLSYEKG